MPDKDSANDGSDSARQERARARNAWPIRETPLRSPASDDLSDSTTATQRLAMVWSLTLDAWAAAGTPLPTYRRSEMPAVIHRRSDDE